MDIFFYIILFIFGSLFGSFASVIIYRLKSGESGILTGRSHCPKCNHILGFFELIPFFSWLKNLGKCKYCKSKISSIYPFLEISTGLLFALIGYFLIDYNLLFSGNVNEIIKLFFWETIGFITIIYSFYDILFLEIEDKTMIFGIIFSIFFLILQSLGIINIFDWFILANNYVVGNIVALFILVFSIIGLYIIMFKELKLIYDFLIIFLIISGIFVFKHYFLGEYIFINSLIGILIFYLFFYIQIIVSSGAWMGGGDLRIAIFVGLLLGYSYSVEGLFATYFIGSILGILFLIFSKIRHGLKSKFNGQIPFGPFIALGFFFIVFVQKHLLELIGNILL